MIYKRVKF